KPRGLSFSRGESDERTNIAVRLNDRSTRSLLANHCDRFAQEVYSFQIRPRPDQHRVPVARGVDRALDWLDIGRHSDCRRGEDAGKTLRATGSVRVLGALFFVLAPVRMPAVPRRDWSNQG